MKRLISDYVHNRAMKRKEKYHTFEEMVFKNESTLEMNEEYKPVHVSKYHIHLRRWMSYFPLNQMHFIDGENFVSNPVPILQGVEKFLGLKPHLTEEHFVFVKTKGPEGFYCKKYHGKPACMGSHKGRSHPNVMETVLNKLYNFYKPHNEIFFNLIGQRFTWPAS